MYKKLRVLFAILLVYVLANFSSPYVKAEEETKEDIIELYARSAVLMDGDSGRVLYGKDENTQMPMASTTKIMTCIVALENARTDLVCTVSGNASAQPKVKLGMIKEDTFYLKDLLYSLMLESHNDTAVCIAENIGGSVEGSADLMNAKAKEIGCENTYYITPNGLDGEDENGAHHTTAKELALVMRYCLTQSPMTEEFLEITRTASYTFTNVKGDRSYGCTNHNALLSILEGALSGKTGFTSKAGYCYVGAVERDGKLLIVSLLACGWPNNKGYKWVDTKKLVRYGLENYESREIVDKSITTDAVRITDGQQDYVRTLIDWEYKNAGEMYLNEAEKNEKMTGNRNESSDGTVLLRKSEQIEKQITMENALLAPVSSGTQVGTVQFLVDGEVYASYPILTAEAVERRDFMFCLKELLEQFLL